MDAAQVDVAQVDVAQVDAVMVPSQVVVVVDESRKPIDLVPVCR